VEINDISIRLASEMEEDDGKEPDLNSEVWNRRKKMRFVRDAITSSRQETLKKNLNDHKGIIQDYIIYLKATT
jgi:hypothetical protein